MNLINPAAFPLRVTRQKIFILAFVVAENSNTQRTVFTTRNFHVIFFWHQIDVYSFGVLLCEMCIRKLPDPSNREVQVSLVTNTEFRGLVRRCLQKTPSMRPTMQEIIDEEKNFILPS